MTAHPSAPGPVDAARQFWVLLDAQGAVFRSYVYRSKEEAEKYKAGIVWHSQERWTVTELRASLAASPEGGTTTMCGICVGEKIVNGEPCICGDGTERGEMNGLRHALFRAQNDLARIQGRPLPWADVFGSDLPSSPSSSAPSTGLDLEALRETSAAIRGLRHAAAPEAGGPVPTIADFVKFVERDVMLPRFANIVQLFRDTSDVRIAIQVTGEMICMMRLFAEGADPLRGESLPTKAEFDAFWQTRYIDANKQAKDARPATSGAREAALEEAAKVCDEMHKSAVLIADGATRSNDGKLAVAVSERADAYELAATRIRSLASAGPTPEDR